jgi:diguanylate cyclase (GGDEF)-like protein
MKISTKLLLIIILLTVLLGITALSSVLSSSNLLEYQIKDKYMAVSSNAMEKIHRLFYGRYLDVRMLASEPVIASRRSTPEQIAKKLGEFKKHFRTYIPYASLSFFDLHTGVRTADTEGTDIGVRHPFTAYWRDITDGKDFVLDISESAPTKERVFHFAHVVKDDDQVPFGLVVARIPVGALHDIVEGPLRLFNAGGAFAVDLLDKNGLILYSTHNKQGTLKETSPTWDILKKAKTPGAKNGAVSFEDREKKQREILFFAREERDTAFKGDEWTLITSIPEQIALAPIIELRDRLILFITVIVLFALGAGFVLSRAITKPIARLSNAVTEVGKGSLDVSVEITSKDEIGQLTGVFNKMVRELHELQEELRTSAAVDALTGAFNRKKIEQLLEWELERATRYNGTLSLILFDLDHFKIVNDTYGHLSGDYVLKTVIRIIQDHIRKTDSLGRWGGEEFMLLVPETCMEQAAELAEKIRRHVELFTYTNVGTVTISCGLAELKVGDTIDSLIKRADDALYQAKRKGRNRVEAGEHLVLI